MSLLDHVRPRVRVLVDNDYSGDPDGLFQLAHHLLSPSVEIVGIIGSHRPVHDHRDPSDHQAENAAEFARRLLLLTGRPDVSVWAGANRALRSATEPQESASARMIIAEALRDDTRPLCYCAGGSLTDLASALLLEPGIAERLTLVWIGGGERVTAAPPAAPRVEFNLAMDIPAAQVIFNDSAVPIWQVDRAAYRQCLMSYAEIDERVRPHGELGAYLADSIEAPTRRAAERGSSFGETYVMGDQPLVLLTALLSGFDADPSSCEWVELPTPRIDDDGQYARPTPTERPMRVYTRLDLRLMFEDFYVKLARHARAVGGDG